MLKSQLIRHDIQISGTTGHRYASGIGIKISTTLLKARVLLVLRWVCDAPSQVNIHFCSIDEMTDLNFKYRNKNQPTDVLSFPSLKLQFLPTDKSHTANALGDIAICVSICESQACKRKISLQSELERMLCHGLVHLKGFDHEMGPAAHRIMSTLERSIMREMKLQLNATNAIPWLNPQERIS